MPGVWDEGRSSAVSFGSGRIPRIAVLCACRLCEGVGLFREGRGPGSSASRIGHRGCGLFFPVTRSRYPPGRIAMVLRLVADGDFVFSFS